MTLKLTFSNTFAALGESFYSKTQARALTNPRLVICDEHWIQKLGLGEIKTAGGPWDRHINGAGPKPYSRFFRALSWIAETRWQQKVLQESTNANEMGNWLADFT